MEDIGTAGTIYIWLFWTAVALMIFTVILFVPISLLCTPIAALMTSRHARRLGSTDPRHYGLVGALYSALLLLPWIYLALNLSGREVPLIFIRVVYIALYVLWAFYLMVTYFLALSLPDSSARWLVLVIGLCAFFLSASVLIRDAVRDGEQRKVLYVEGDYQLTRRRLIYLTPFAFLMIQPLVLFLPLLLWDI